MIRSLTGLRFYAALLVFISHFWLYGYFMNLSTGPVYQYLQEIGWVGVSVFFTLSGFILLVNYLNPDKLKTLEPLSFYRTRLARIYPVFLLGVLIAIPLRLLSPFHRDFWLPLLLNLSLLHCFHPTACSSFNLVGWSLSVEFLFYLLFPALLALFKVKPLQNFAFVMGLYLVYLLGMAYWLPDSFYSYLTFPVNRLGEFITGMGAGYLFLKYRQHPAMWQFKKLPLLKTQGLVLIVLLVGLMTLVPMVLVNFPLLDRFSYLFYIVPSSLVILILAGLENMDLSLELFSNPKVVLGGEISYSFYIIHHLIMRYVEHLLRFVFQIDVKLLNLPTGLALATMILLTSLGSAFFIYQKIEIPCRRLLLNGFKAKRERYPELV
jgi:peptidoglycan/LPS O-acetylase OafA/YrhL